MVAHVIDLIEPYHCDSINFKFWFKFFRKIQNVNNLDKKPFLEGYLF